MTSERQGRHADPEPGLQSSGQGRMTRAPRLDSRFSPHQMIQVTPVISLFSPALPKMPLMIGNRRAFFHFAALLLAAGHLWAAEQPLPKVRIGKDRSEERRVGKE